MAQRIRAGFLGALAFLSVPALLITAYTVRECGTSALANLMLMALFSVIPAFLLAVAGFTLGITGGMRGRSAVTIYAISCVLAVLSGLLLAHPGSNCRIDL